MKSFLKAQFESVLLRGHGKAEMQITHPHTTPATWPYFSKRNPNLCCCSGHGNAELQITHPQTRPLIWLNFSRSKFLIEVSSSSGTGKTQERFSASSCVRILEAPLGGMTSQRNCSTRLRIKTASQWLRNHALTCTVGN